MKEFVVNEYITLKLEDGKTKIYVNGEYFRQCKFLLLDIPIQEVSSFDDIMSIDEAVEKLDPHQRKYGIISNRGRIPPETAFWGHCSNLQAWAENKYNTNIIHSNLAFPLLKKLSDLGDPQAKKVFKEEIVKRFNRGYKSVIIFLLENNYLRYLTKEESEIINYKSNKNLREALDNIQEQLGESLKLDRYLLKELIEKENIKLKQFIIDHTFKALTLEGFDKLFNINDITIFFGYLPDTVKEDFLNNYAKDIENIITKTLEEENKALNKGLPLLLALFEIKFPPAVKMLKEGVIKWLFHGTPATVDHLITNYIRLIKGYVYIEKNNHKSRQAVRFFDSTELRRILEDTLCPTQIKEYINKNRQINIEH